MPKSSTGRSIATVVIAALGASAGLLAAPSVQGVAPPTYTFTDLGTPGGNRSIATAINNVGQVVGYGSTDPSSFSHAFIWQNGIITPLDDDGAASSQALDINDAGAIVGAASFSRSEDTGVFWPGQNGQPIALGSLGPLNVSTYANAINNAGAITGNSNTENFFSPFHAFLWQNGVMRDLGTLGGRSSSGKAINNAGAIAGFAGVQSNEPHAALWQNGLVTDLGTLGGARSGANDINDRGAVVGESRLADGTSDRAFLWQNGAMRDLGTLGGDNSIAHAINEANAIVGAAETTTGETHAVLWSNGSPLDLNSVLPPGSPWTLVEANDINEDGEIVGVGEINGQERAFLLTPTVDPPPAMRRLYLPLLPR